LLSIDFVRLILGAAMISLPLAYFAMGYWLSGYAYKIELGWILFALPVALILLIAMLTMSFQVLRAAMTNPADTLKHE